MPHDGLMMGAQSLPKNAAPVFLCLSWLRSDRDGTINHANMDDCVCECSCVLCAVCSYYMLLLAVQVPVLVPRMSYDLYNVRIPLDCMPLIFYR